MTGAAGGADHVATVGGNLRAARLAATPPWTIARLAQAAGCSPALVSRVEAGTVAPSLSTLAALARALGVGVGDLVDPAAPARRAGAAIAAARTALLLGHAPDLGDVTRAGDDPATPPAWRARAFALVAVASPARATSTVAVTKAEASLAAIAARPVDHPGNGGLAPHLAAAASRPVAWPVDLARLEVAWAAGEAAWMRGDADTAARRWGNGLAVRSTPHDVESAWARAAVARSLARVAPGTRVAANALAVAVATLAPIADPAAVAARLASGPPRDPPVDASLALAIVGAAQVALADARARLAALPTVATPAGAPPDLPLGRHLR